MTQSLYRHYDSSGTLLYVGVSLSVLVRLKQHEASHWFGSIARVEIQRFTNRQAVLEAERVAVATENPLHNVIRFKTRAKSIKTLRAEMQAEKLAAAAAESRQAIVERFVSFQPMYSVQEAARALTLSIPHTKRLIAEGKLGSMVMGELRGSQTVRISGWQLVDFIEQVQAGVVKP